MQAKSANNAQPAPVIKRHVASANLPAQVKADLAKILHSPGRYDRRGKMQDYAEGLNVETVQALLEDLATKPLDPHFPEEFQALVARWAELDPQAALAWTRNLHDQNMKGYAIEQVFDAWSAKSPAEAFNALTQLKDASSIGYCRVEVIQNYALQEPQDAFAKLSSQPAGKFSDLYPLVFQIWAAQDPADAAVAVQALPPGTDLNMSQANIAGSWAEQDPAAAMAWAKTLPKGTAQNGAVTAVLNVLAQIDPASAVEYAMSNLPAGSASNNLINTSITNWAQQDPAELFSWANQNLTGAAYDTAIVSALRQMGTSDPTSAAADLAQLSDPNVVNQAVSALAAAWTQQDPQAALAWAQSLPADNATVRDLAMKGVFDSWLAINPTAAASYIQQNLTADSSFSALASHAATTWASTDPQAALNWAESLPVGAQDSAAVAVIQQMAKINPPSAENAAQNALNNLTGLTLDQQTALQKIVDKAPVP